MATKKNKKKNKKIIIIPILLLIIIILLVVYIALKPITNIYISGNNILSDKDIITISKLDNYPSFLNTYLIKIKDRLLKNNYIKNAKINRKLSGKIYIHIDEYKPICIYNDNLVLSSKNKVVNKYNIDYVPYVINNIDNIYDKFVEQFSLLDTDILLKISQIEYIPNDVDKERFILYMIDSNYVYTTLSKIEKVNKYNLIINELENKKGIIYLDSGDYVEIKG